MSGWFLGPSSPGPLFYCWFLERGFRRFWFPVPVRFMSDPDIQKTKVTKLAWRLRPCNYCDCGILYDCLREEKFAYQYQVPPEILWGKITSTNDFFLREIIWNGGGGKNWTNALQQVLVRRFSFPVPDFLSQISVIVWLSVTFLVLAPQRAFEAERTKKLIPHVKLR